MTNRQHRQLNTVLSITLFIMLIVLVLTIVKVEDRIENKIERCETILYEKLTGQKDPLRSER